MAFGGFGFARLGSEPAGVTFNGGQLVRTVNGSGTLLIDALGNALSPLLGGYLSSSANAAASLPGNVTVTGLNVGVNVAMGPPNPFPLMAPGLSGVFSGYVMNSYKLITATTGSSTFSGTAQLITEIIPPSPTVFTESFATYSLGTYIFPSVSCTLPNVNGTNTINRVGGPGVATITAINGDNNIAASVASGSHTINTSVGSTNLGVAATGAGTVTVASSIGVRGTGVQTFNATQNVTTATGVRGLGLVTDVSSTSGVTTVTNSLGASAVAFSCSAGTNTVTLGAAFVAGTPVLAAPSTCTTCVGVEVQSQGLSTITTAAGIRLQPIVNAATNNYGIWFLSNTANAGSGINFGSPTADTSFWRGAAAQLLTQGDWMTRHYLCSSVPTVAAGAGAGTSPTIGIAGTDHGFTVTLTQGNPTGTGTIFTVTFGAAFTTQRPRFAMAPMNSAASLIQGTVQTVNISTASSTTQMILTSGATGLTATTQYIWDFVCMR